MQILQAELYFMLKHKGILCMFLECVFIGGFLSLVPGTVGPSLQPEPCGKGALCLLPRWLT